MEYSNCFEGSGFGASQGGSVLALGGSAVPADSWSDTQICITTPDVTLGATTVQVTVAAGQSNAFNLTITGKPSITSVSPSAGVAGTQVTVTGMNLGTVQYASSSITWNTHPLMVVSWSDTQIVATIPAGLPLGTFPVQVVDNGWPAQSSPFTVTTPLQINSVTDNTGSTALLAVGSAAIIHGSGFGSSQGSTERPATPLALR